MKNPMRYVPARVRGAEEVVPYLEMLLHEQSAEGEKLAKLTSEGLRTDYFVTATRALRGVGGRNVLPDRRHHLVTAYVPLHNIALSGLFIAAKNPDSSFSRPLRLNAWVGNPRALDEKQVVDIAAQGLADFLTNQSRMAYKTLVLPARPEHDAEEAWFSDIDLYDPWREAVNGNAIQAAAFLDAFTASARQARRAQ